MRRRKERKRNERTIIDRRKFKMKIISKVDEKSSLQ